MKNGSQSLTADRLRQVAAYDPETGLLGVARAHQKEGFFAAITTGGKTRHLGTYRTAELAHLAYVKAKRELHEGCTL